MSVNIILGSSDLPLVVGICEYLHFGAGLVESTVNLNRSVFLEQINFSEFSFLLYTSGDKISPKYPNCLPPRVHDTY